MAAGMEKRQGLQVYSREERSPTSIPGWAIWKDLGSTPCIGMSERGLVESG